MYFKVSYLASKKSILIVYYCKMATKMQDDTFIIKVGGVSIVAEWLERSS